MDYWINGLMDYWINGLLDYWISGLLTPDTRHPTPITGYGLLATD